MAGFKQGQLNQVLCVMVDKTNFASVESGVTSGFTCTLYTYKQNSSGATSAVTLSRAPSVVRSGIIRVVMKTTETSGVDNALLKIAHASCADQYIPINFQVQDISNYLSDASAIRSNIYSMLSDFYSTANSQFAVVSNYLSNISNAVSNIDADLANLSGVVSDFYSDFGSRVPKAVATNSQLSDLASDLKSYMAGMSGAISDIDSALASQYTAGHPLAASDMSDLRSAIAAVTATVGASDISDIASAVWANAIGARVDSRVLLNLSRISDVDSQLNVTASKVDNIENRISDLESLASDAHSAAAQANSRILVVQSMVSDVDSALTSQFTAGHPLNASDLSDIRSAITAKTFDLSASDLSDIRSVVLSLSGMLSDAHSAAAQANSRALVVQSKISDVESALDSQFAYLSAAISDAHSDLYSALGAVSVALGASEISDIASAVAASIEPAAIGASDISDIASAVWAYASRKLTSMADVTISASDMSDIRSAITAGGAAITDSNISDIASAVWANTIGARVDSRILKALSDTSNIYSLLNAGVPIGASSLSDIRSAISDYGSKFASDIKSAIAVIPNLSDAVSDVYTRQASQFAVISNYLSNASSVESNIYSLLSAGAPMAASDLSDIRSAITAKTFDLSASDLSDIRSAVLSLSGMISDAHSAAAQANSRALVIQSKVSDVESALDSQFAHLSAAISDAHSDIYSLLSNVNSQVYQTNRIMKNKMSVESATGDISLFNDASDAVLANGSVTESSGNVTRSPLNFV